MNILKIAMLQLISHGMDQAANQEKGLTYCRDAAQMGADIILYPEMWNIGYSFFDPDSETGHEEWLSQAVDDESEFISRHRALARELGIAISVTYLQKSNGAPRNSVSLIDRTGEIV